MIASASDGDVLRGQERRRHVRRPRSDSEAMPGVSMSVTSSRRFDGHSTSIRSTSSAGVGPRSRTSRPSSRRTGSDAGAAGAEVHGDAGRRAVAVPGDDLGALAGVRRGDLLADDRVQQRRLAGLHHAGDGDAQRLVEPRRRARRACGAPRRRRGTRRRRRRAVRAPRRARGRVTPEPSRRCGSARATVAASVGLLRAPPSRAASGACGPVSIARARFVSASTRSRSRRRAVTRLSRSAAYIVAAFCAASTESASERWCSSAIAVKWSRVVRCTIRRRSCSCLPTWKMTRRSGGG